ncbi:uncharacterized protein LOC114850013 isoform X2 [Betta splendens]|uniref:Uncharacterized protein LOC114850013 isoform X2 n=1 Tax=Betta splendens TaxID=158456 RepID=A0A6P7LV40_BETSP|nr:uncharacterized protein LOC114850013 isoform X2 [Betta splendens]
MEYSLIVAVSGFPSLYDSSSPTYRDLNTRSDSWRQVAQIVGFPDARAAGTNGWALDPQPSLLQVSEMMGCSTTTGTRSDDDESYDIAVADATPTSSSSSLEFVQRKRPSSSSGDAVRLKAAKIEPSDQQTPPAVLQPDLQPFQHRQSRCSPPPAGAASRLNRLKTEVRETVDLTDEEYEDCSITSPRLTQARTENGDSVLEDYLRRMEAREVHRDRGVDLRDDVTLFLLSLAPAMRRLCTEKQSWVRTKIQQLLHEAEFGATHF